MEFNLLLLKTKGTVIKVAQMFETHFIYHIMWASNTEVGKYDRFNFILMPCNFSFAFFTHTHTHMQLVVL